MGVDAVRDDAVVQLLQRQPLRRQHADDARVAMVELTTHEDVVLDMIVCTQVMMIIWTLGRRN